MAFVIMAYLKIQIVILINLPYTPITCNVNGRVHSGICDNANRKGKERKFTFRAIITDVLIIRPQNSPPPPLFLVFTYSMLFGVNITYTRFNKSTF